jgi:hypothetical protein
MTVTAAVHTQSRRDLARYRRQGVPNRIIAAMLYLTASSKQQPEPCACCACRTLGQQAPLLGHVQLQLGCPQSAP